MNKKEILLFLTSTKFDIQCANAALLIADMVFHPYAQSENAHGVNFSPLFGIVQYGRRDAFYQLIPLETINKVADKTYEDFIKKPGSYDSTIGKHMKLTERIDKAWSKFEKKGIKRASDLEIGRCILEIIEISKKWWEYGVILENKGRIIDERLIPEFAERHGMKEEKARDIFNLLSHPEEKSVFNMEREAFLGVCLFLSKKMPQAGEKNLKTEPDAKLRKMSEDYVKDFFWIKTDFYRAKKLSLVSVADLALSEIKIKGKTELSKELKVIKNNFEKIHAHKLVQLKKMKLGAKDRKDIYFAEKTIVWMDQRKAGMMKQFYYLYNLIEELGKRLNMDYEELTLYSSKELVDLVKSNWKVKPGEIARRRKRVFLAFEKGRDTQMFYGEDAKSMLKAALGKREKGGLKGMVASTGGRKKISGKARVVYKPDKEDFKMGEILVTSMTRIEFVPLMRRAKAIITDEGGIACHAAIISREMGLPCIIGTKNATRVLKNGDEAEMDLETGVIEVVNKNNN
jgi:phosphohistidine swiveling domain-containing protein